MCAVGSPSVMTTISLLPPLRPAEQLARDDQRVLEVRAVLELVRRQRRDRLRLQLARVVREADDVQPIARVLRVDQRVERHRHLLGRR